MTKNINGDVYSDLITSSDARAMACGVIPRATIDRIVIHHNAAMNKNVAISTWLANGSAQTSAHYEVADGEIIGIVGEGTTAWHAGNGPMNARSIGIENVNNSLAPNWTISNDTFESLCRLVADIAKRYGFPIDRTHVIPHKDVVPTACPGGIDVNKVIARANQIAGNNNSGNNTSENKVDQILHKGEYFKSGVYRVDEFAHVYGLDQLVSYSLAGTQNPTWKDYGLSPESVDKCDKNGKINWNDQKINVGDYFRLHNDSRIKVTYADGNIIKFGTRYGECSASPATLTEVK